MLGQCSSAVLTYNALAICANYQWRDQIQAGPDINFQILFELFIA